MKQPTAPQDKATETKAPTPVNPAHRGIALGALIAFVAGMAAFGVWRMSSRSTNVPVPQDEHVAVNAPDPVIDDQHVPTQEELDAMNRQGYDEAHAGMVAAYEQQLKDVRLLRAAKETDLVKWEVPTVLKETLGIFHNFTYDYPENGEPVMRLLYGEPPYLRLGEFTKGDYAGHPLYMVDAPCEGPCSYLVRFTLVNDDVVVFTKYSDDFGGSGDVANMIALTGKFHLRLDDKTTLDGLDFGKEVRIEKPVSTVLTLGNAYHSFQGFFSPTADQKPLFVDLNYGPAFNGNNGAITFQAADGSARYYLYTPDFVKDNAVPPITWKDGSKNADPYYYQSLGGCGFQNYGMVIEAADTDLKVIGTLASGQSVYGYADANAQPYHDVYDNMYYAPDGKLPFETFVSQRPLFIWRDPFGRLMRFIDTKFTVQAECGKPVIYLYPPKTTDVSVKVAPTGGFTYTEPEYGAGWEVTAEPNGRLTQKGTGAQYPYLFWEGRSDSIWHMPERGFSVAQADVPTFLDDKLAKLGLNDREIADFKEFWVPKFTGHPYFFVTFSGNQLMDRIAPLTVEPKPDTVIRVLMDFEGTDVPKIAPEPVLHAPVRNGFSVVEWGGVLH